MMDTLLLPPMQDGGVALTEATSAPPQVCGVQLGWRVACGLRCAAPPGCCSAQRPALQMCATGVPPSRRLWRTFGGS